MTPPRFTHIGRAIDPAYPTNRAIAFITVAVGILVGVGALWQSGDIPASAWRAFLTAGAVFLAWALGRELDPDRQPPAFLAAALALSCAVFVAPPPLLPAAWMLLVLRVVNRSTGRKPTPADQVVVTLFGAWMAFSLHPVFGYVTALALFLDDRLDGTVSSGTYMAVAVALASPFLPWLGEAPATSPSLPAIAAALACVLVFIPTWRRCAVMQSPDDVNGGVLIPRRVRAAQALGLLGGVLLALVDGYAGLFTLATFWSAILAAGIYRPAAS